MRVLAIFTGTFSVGIFLAQYLIPEIYLIPGAGICFLIACCAILTPVKIRRRMFLIGIALSLSLGWDWLYLRQVQRPMELLADTMPEGPALLTVCDYPVPTDYGAKATVSLAGFSPGKAVFYGDKNLLDLCPGQIIQATGKFQSAARVQDTDITTFTSKGIFLLIRQTGQAVYLDGSIHSPRWWPVRVGHAMKNQIAQLFSSSDQDQQDTAAFLTAILTGDKSGLSPSAASDLSEAGLSHILAVSGMHCGFLLLLTTFLVGRQRQRLLAIITIPLLIFYALLTGASPSIVRACVMLIFLLIAPIFRRNSDASTALATALFCILFSNPFAAASLSLQLSFGATLGLIWVTPGLSKLLSGKKSQKAHGKIFSTILISISSTIGALVFTVPLSFAYFGVFSLLSPISGLLCLWAASLTFLWGLAAIALSFLCMPLGVLLSWIPKLLISYILTVSHILTRIPGHALYRQNPYLWHWMIACCLLFGILYLFYLLKSLKLKSCEIRKRNYALATLLAVLTLFLTVKLGKHTLTQGAMDIRVLDVGQGESILLNSENSFALIDCGSGNSWYNPGDLAVNTLFTMGGRNLDTLILTHYDYDHVSGIELLMSRLSVKNLFLPDYQDDAGLSARILAAASNYHVNIDYIREKTEISLGAGKLTIFPPVGLDANLDDDNECGLSILASCNQYDFLITGDMNSKVEQILLSDYSDSLSDIETLVVGHHGSKYSTSEEFLQALLPKTAVISVGDNSYGHPTDDVLRRLQAIDTIVYRTDLQGTIWLSIPANNHKSLS